MRTSAATTGGVVGPVLLALSLVGAAPGVRAQEAVPGARTEVVRLDAVVTDASGNLVRDLAREDFELRDDGKVQSLTHFVYVGTLAGVPGPPGDAARAPEAAAPGAGAPGETAPPRQIVILVDDLHITPGSLQPVKDALHRLLNELLLPGDNVGLLTTSSSAGVQSLKQERGALEKAIDALSLRQAGVAPARGSQMTPEQAELILRGDRGAQLLAGRMISEEPGSVYEGNGGPRAAVASLPGANPGGAGEDSKERAASVEAQQQARAILSESLRFSSVSLARIDDVLRGMASLPGRKLCLLVSEGFLVGTGTSEERTQELRGILDAATRSGSVVYALDPRGVVTGGLDSSAGRSSGTSPGLDASVARQAEGLLRTTLETISNDTGGFLVRATNDLAGGLRRMLEDNEAYYLMAYEPTNPKRDGRFRKIELRLKAGRQLVVRTRKGYYAPDDRKQAIAPPRGLTDAEGRAALGQPMAESGSLDLSADFVAPATGPQAVVRAHVGVAGLAWRKADLRARAALHLVGGAYDADGRAVGPLFGGRKDLDLGRAELERAKAEGVDFQEQLALPAGRYQIRVVARDLEGKVLGSGAQWIEIPNLADKKLALSGVFLSSSPSAAPALRDFNALRHFKRSDGLYFQFYVYNPVVDADGSSDALIQAQIWAQSKVAAASKPQPATLLAKDGVSILQGNGMSLDSLEPGAYQLRIVVVDRKANATAMRAIDFTVN